MSQENIAVVERSVAAVNARDIDGYLACCAEDIELRTPWVAAGGVYQGAADIVRFFADVEDAASDFVIELERLEAIGGDRVLAFVHATATGRTSGIPNAADTANVYDLAAGKIRRITIFLDREEALEAVGLRE